MATNRIKLRGDTAANWTAANPVLGAREKGIETDTNREKNGDGVTAWNALPYVADVLGSNVPRRPLSTRSSRDRPRPVSSPTLPS